MTADLAFALERHYAATPDRVWAHFADPGLMAAWFCPNPTLPTRCVLDVRPGGAWRCEMGDHVVSGAYVEVDPPSRLVFTWSWAHEDPATTVAVTLSPEDGGTRLRLEHAETEAGLGDQGHRGGWELSLARLEQAVD